MSDESGFREKKLFFCTDLGVVEASKVVNKLLTETGFSFILPILNCEGGRGPLFEGVACLT